MSDYTNQIKQENRPEFILSVKAPLYHILVSIVLGIHTNAQATPDFLSWTSIAVEQKYDTTVEVASQIITFVEYFTVHPFTFPSDIPPKQECVLCPCALNMHAILKC